MTAKRIFVINPGSTSTKLALFEDDTMIWQSGAHHPLSELNRFNSIAEQYPYRMEFIKKRLADSDIEIRFDAVIGRGGLTKPLKGGVYRVNDKMIDDLKNAKDQHACNLGAIMAKQLATEGEGIALTADPVVVDEMDDVARYTGIPGIKRRSVFHALNQKAVARRYAQSVGKRYEELNIIVAHMGGGISIGAHRQGRVADVNNALNGEGPFSTERAGTLPASDLVDLCMDGNRSKKQIMSMIHGKGGLTAYLGTNDMITISRMAEEGEQPAKDVLEAMLYTVAKQIGAMTVTMKGHTDAIIITGGIAHSSYCMQRMKEWVGWIAPITIIPGENEILSMAYNALGALNGQLTVKEYK